MNIYEYYTRHTINGAPRSELLSVFRCENPHLSVRESNGRLLLVPQDDIGKKELARCFNSRVIKCVKEYYQNPDEWPLSISSSNAFLACDKVRDYLGLTHSVSRSDCRGCHLCALQKAAEGSIEYK